MTSHPIRRRSRIWRTPPRPVLGRRRPRWSPGRLDPAGRLRPPGRSTTLRAALVVALLLAAVTLGYRDLRAVDREAVGSPPGQLPISSADDAPVMPTATPAAAPVPDTEPGPATDPARGWPDIGVWPGDGEAGHTAASDDPVRLPVPAGMVGVAVPLAEPAMLAVLRPGDRVDLLSVPVDGGAPLLVAGDAGVLAVEPTTPALLLSLTDDQARAVLSPPPGTRLAVTVQP